MCFQQKRRRMVGHGAVWNRREPMKKNIEILALPAWPLPWRGCWWAVAPGSPEQSVLAVTAGENGGVQWDGM